MLGALMFISKIIMELLPNIHLLGTFIMVYTLVFRRKALIPIYVFVLITGLYSGFATWWIPYLYIWAILWGFAMLLPKRLTESRWAYPIYSTVSALFGLLFGTLYAPAQALLFGLDFDGMIAWIIAGIPMDLLHAAGNFAAGFLIVPLYSVLHRLAKSHGMLH